MEEVAVKTTYAMRLAGVTHGGRQEIVKRMEQGDRLEIVREPENEYDKNACAVYWRECQAGYIPAKIASDLAPLLDMSDVVVDCFVVERLGGGGISYGAEIVLELNDRRDRESCTR